MGEKTYDLVGWADEASGETPVNSDNLNHMDKAIKYLYDEGATSKDIFICGDGQTLKDAPEEAKIVFENNYIKTKASEVINSMDGSQTDLAPSVDAVKNYVKEVYSTDEVKTNKLWFGKPVYRRTYSTVLGGEQLNTITTDLDSNCFVINTYGIISNGLTAFQLPTVRVNYPDYATEFYIQNGNIICNFANASRDGYTLYATIEYTKTTD